MPNVIIGILGFYADTCIHYFDNCILEVFVICHKVGRIDVVATQKLSVTAFVLLTNLIDVMSIFVKI
jgi:hypothetical protein